MTSPAVSHDRPDSEEHATTPCAEMEGESRNKNIIVLLAAGYGTRLKAVTGGLPKSLLVIDEAQQTKGIDVLQKAFDAIPHDSVVLYLREEERLLFSAYSECGEYTEELRMGEEQTGTALHRIIEKFGHEYRYLVLSQDIYFDEDDWKSFEASAMKDAIQWAVFDYVPMMKEYYGLVVENGTNAVVGDVGLDSYFTHSAVTRLATKGAIHAVDPDVYEDVYNHFLRLRTKRENDWYWDVLPFIEKMNHRRVRKGQPSILQATWFKQPIFDYGTPERLTYLRNTLHHSKHTHA